MRRVQVGDITVEYSGNGVTLRLGAAGDMWSQRRELTVPRSSERDLLLAINAYFGREPARSDQ